MTLLKHSQRPNPMSGVTLIELVIVVAITGILLSAAVPSYQVYMLRVHRTEAIGLLLRASLCQQRVRATYHHFDTSRCIPLSESGRYHFSFEPAATQGNHYIAIASPRNAQQSDECGSLTLDQNGLRGSEAADISVAKCWSGR